MVSYAATPRATATRLRERMTYDADVVHAILDEAYVCHLGFVVDGEPRVLPTLLVRIDDTVYVHGSTGSRPLLAARSTGELPVCLTVTLIDGLVLARSQFHHSANYRSVVAHGVARLVTDEDEKDRVFRALMDKAGGSPGSRSLDTRPPTPRELAQTAVLALPLRDVSAKFRAHGVGDDEEDYGGPYWAGVLPLRLVPGVPEPDEGITLPVPEYLRPVRSPWLAAPTLTGRHVKLELLDLSHVDGLRAGLDDPEVWQHLTTPRPGSVEEYWEFCRRLIDDWAAGTRVPFVQRDAATGEVIGTTSYLNPDPVNRTVEIGSTLLGRRWWRTAMNTEAKLLLMTRAFEDLGAVRVQWQTDNRNERSQRAIERLGAVREGVLRADKLRGDGTWRDSVIYGMTAPEWPAARLRLLAALSG
jgi:uncharacterized protein